MRDIHLSKEICRVPIPSLFIFIPTSQPSRWVCFFGGLTVSKENLLVWWSLLFSGGPLGQDCSVFSGTPSFMFCSKFIKKTVLPPTRSSLVLWWPLLSKNSPRGSLFFFCCALRSLIM